VRWIGKDQWKDCNGTVGFIDMGEALGHSPMLSQEGNPHARNLLELVAYLQKADGGPGRGPYQ
jgi:hypothetical protein